MGLRCHEPYMPSSAAKYSHVQQQPNKPHFNHSFVGGHHTVGDKQWLVRLQNSHLGGIGAGDNPKPG